MRQLALGMAVRSNTSGLPLMVDNFAGGGGASKGIEMAFGRSVDIAINHDGEALVMHSANHPSTAHYQEDVFDVHPGFVTGQRRIGLAWFSPDCKHHSKAKGGKPRDQKIRGLAWVVLKWGALQKPRCIAIENVVELLTWGPLDDNGKPIKEKAGRTFNAFIDALTHGLDPSHPDVPEIYKTLGADFPMEKLYQGLGYAVEYRVLRASDFGVPTTRTRLFIFARCDGQPICWPAPTHGDPKAKGFAASGLKPWRTAAECIDFNLPSQSIFDRAKLLATNTERRIAKGMWRHVLTSAKPFIVGAGGPESVADTVDTVATENYRRQGAQLVLTPFLTEHANSSTQRTMAGNEPVRTICAQVKGGHFSVVSPKMAPLVMTNTTGHPGASVEQPVPALTTGGQQAVVAPMVVPLRGTSEAHLGCHASDVPLSVVSAGGQHHAVAALHITKFNTGSVGSDMDKPMPTVTAGGTPKRASTGITMGVVAANMITIGYGERKGQQARTNDVEQPLGTVVAANKHAVVATHMAPVPDLEAQYLVDMGHGESWASGTGRWSHGMRSLDNPLGTIAASGVNNGVAAIHITHLTHHGERSGHAAENPLPTVTGANRGEQAMVAAFLEQANGGFYDGDGRGADVPMSTITASGTQQRLVTAHLVKYYSEGGLDSACSEPMHTIPTKARMGLVNIVEVPADFLSEEHARKAKMCADLLHKHLPEHFAEPAEMVLLFMQGQWWVLVDITLRMLTPRELARAQGFPDDYEIAPMVRRYKRAKTSKTGKAAKPQKEWDMVPLSKSAQVRMIGNTVCPPLVCALLEVNFTAQERMLKAA